MTASELRVRREQACQEAEAIIQKAEADNEGKGRSLTDDEQKRFDALKGEIDGLKDRIDRAGFTESLGVPPKRSTPPPQPESGNIHPEDKRTKVPATAKRFHKLQNLGRLRYLETYGEKQDLAYRMGMWGLATMGKSSMATRFCQQNGLELRYQNETVNTQGGYLVPEELDSAMIDLREQYGIFRQFARSVPMGSDTKMRMRRVGGLTAYFTSEGGAITDSTATWDKISLVAKDLGAISLVTNDLNEDSIVSLGDTLAGEIAYAFANKEDLCGFVGDGTSTYGGILGVTKAFEALSATRTSIAGAVQGTGNAWSELVIGDFNSVMGKLPVYADTPNAAWFCHKVFWAEAMLRLETAAGGVTGTELVNGFRRPMFMGYPVVFSQVMPKAAVTDRVCAFFGDLSLAADFGDRRQTTISLSDSATVGSVNCFEQAQIAIRGTERFDINVHDIGNVTATAADQVPGPLIALFTLDS